MIEVIFATEDNSAEKEIIIEGHSNYRVKGQDIVCAAISSTSQMIAYYLKEKYPEFIVLEETKDMLYIRLNASLQTAEEMFNAFFIFTKALEKQYPKQVKLLTKAKDSINK